MHVTARTLLLCVSGGQRREHSGGEETMANWKTDCERGPLGAVGCGGAPALQTGQRAMKAAEGRA